MEEIKAILADCHAQGHRIEEHKRQLDDLQKDSKQEANGWAQKVEWLEKIHNETIEDVLKDAQNITPYDEISNWICPIIDRLTPYDIKANHNMKSPSNMSDYILNLWMDKENDRKLMRLLKYIKLPNIKKITITYLEGEDQDIDSFLQHSFPDKLKYFYIYGIYNEHSCIGISKYMNALIKCLPKI